MRKWRFLVIFLLLLGLIVGCYYEDNPKKIKDTFLPHDAKEVKILGNGWVQFELDGEQYLFHGRYILVPIPQQVKK